MTRCWLGKADMHDPASSPVLQRLATVERILHGGPVHVGQIDRRRGARWFRFDVVGLLDIENRNVHVPSRPLG